VTEPVAIDLDHLRGWIGRTETRVECATPVPIAALAATLDRDDPAPSDGTPVPPLWHWTYFVSLTRQSEIGPDGHAKRGGFLPPVPLPRRMWAGGEITFLEPLRVGDEVTRSSTIADVTLKTGSTGALCFVSVDHVISTARGVAIRERQDIVYRDNPTPTAAPAKPVAPPPAARHRETHFADAVLLFRYSALTFNGHRIHYDRDYVIKVEGYPGLIFHGPMQAALLVEFAAKLRGSAPNTFSYRGVQPLFDGAEFSVNANDTANGLELWTANADGTPTLKGTATW